MKYFHNNIFTKWLTFHDILSAPWCTNIESLTATTTTTPGTNKSYVQMHNFNENYYFLYMFLVL